MVVLIFRTTILYIAATIIIRLMGKRQIGELQPFELVITIMISELATLPMQDVRMPLLHGIIPMVTLLILQIIVSIIQLKSTTIRKFISGKPSILICNGKIDINELKYQRLNVNDLMEELRLKGYFNLSDIKYAILETSGQLSIIPCSELMPTTRKDLNIQVRQDKIPITLILDGKLNKTNLQISNKSISWLNNQLKQNNISSINDIFVGILDSNGDFYYQLNNNGSDKK
ncbi:DUF421 domain-containing protein [Haloimpatiens sp. FM7330]|uniref:DUF421 domain-containing protein n=1 Tax=Haloimpatiens sp. FM7330 TaxID=3298610 RepID=UPI00362C41DC